MRAFKKFSLLSIFFTYLVIFVGGLVRVSGAGLGCPDWPKCFGSWIPPLHMSQVPPEFNPLTFNITLAWIEYINRLVGMTVGLLIAITAVLAIIHFRKNKSILIPSIASALLVAYQGWQGSRVVASELAPMIVTVHMVIAFIIISLLIYVYMQAHFISNPEEVKRAKYINGIHWGVVFVWLISIVQVLLGTQVRGALEQVREHFPLDKATEWLAQIGGVDDLHMTLGGMVAFGAWVLGFAILKFSKNAPVIVIQTAWAMIVILLLQIVLGLALVMAGLPSLLQLFHLWLASLLIGALLILYTTIRKGEGQLNG